MTLLSIFGNGCLGIVCLLGSFLGFCVIRATIRMLRKKVDFDNDMFDSFSIGGFLF